jgi:hypothetical protein
VILYRKGAWGLYDDDTWLRNIHGEWVPFAGHTTDPRWRCTSPFPDGAEVTFNGRVIRPGWWKEQRLDTCEKDPTASELSEKLSEHILDDRAHCVHPDEIKDLRCLVKRDLETIRHREHEYYSLERRVAKLEEVPRLLKDNPTILKKALEIAAREYAGRSRRNAASCGIAAECHWGDTYEKWIQMALRGDDGSDL